MTLTIVVGDNLPPKRCSTEDDEELAQILEAVRHAAEQEDLTGLHNYHKAVDLWLHHAGDYERLTDGEWQVFCAINDALAELLRRRIETADDSVPPEVVNVLPALKNRSLQELKARAEGDEDRLFREFYVSSADYESDDSDVEELSEAPESKTRFARQKRGGRRRPTRRSYRGFDPPAAWIRDRMERIKPGFGVAYGEAPPQQKAVPKAAAQKKQQTSKKAVTPVEPPFQPKSDFLTPDLEALVAQRSAQDKALKARKQANGDLEEWLLGQIRREHDRGDSTLFGDGWPTGLEKQKERLVAWVNDENNATDGVEDARAELQRLEAAKKKAETQTAVWVGMVKDYFETRVRGARSWGTQANDNARIYYPPNTWTTEVKAELKAVNDALKSGEQIPANRFLVAQYRGIAYNTNVFEAAARRRSRESVELKLPVYCSAVFDAAGISPAVYYAGGFIGNQDVNRDLAEAAQKLRAALLSKRSSGPIKFTDDARAIFRGEAKPQPAEASGSAKPTPPKKDSYSRKLSWSTSGGFTYSNAALAMQNFYTINYKGFFEQVELHVRNSAVAAKSQESSGHADSPPESDAHSFRQIFDGLTSAKNPLVSTGNTPRHSLRYAYSMKYYSNTDKPHKLVPDWSAEDGRTRHPYSGKVYLSLHEPSDYDWKTGALDVVGLASRDELDVPSDILGEREAAFPAVLPENRVIAEHIARYPSFAGSYKIAYFEKYGLTEAEWKTYQALNSLAVNEAHRDKLLDAVSEWLVRFHEARLIELARRLAENEKKILVYVGPDGQLVEGTDENVSLKVNAPRGASKTDPEHTTLDSGLSGRDSEEREHLPAQTGVPRGPLPLVGIVNWQYECYINSVLQLLRVLRPDTNYERAEGNVRLDSFAPVVLEFLQKLRADAADGTYAEDGVARFTLQSTMELRKILKRLNICDTLYSQEDAGAALAAMLYTFNHVGLGFDESPAALAALSSEQFLNRRPSRFHLRFKITTTYDTSKGGQDDPVTDPILLDEENRSVRYETGTMLQLQFPPLAAEEVSLDTLMTYFRTRNYPVEEVETAKCRQGDRYYPAARRVRVETEIADSAPRLILLSRYVYREATKTDEAAPVQVKSRVTMPDQIAGKRLLAVIRHYGTSPRNGHYVAAIRENEQWYLANDHYVRLLSVEETRDMIAAGYIYYYG